MWRSPKISLPKVGFRREASILLPAALLGLIALSTFTLFSYRASISRLVDDERSRAASTAAAIATRLGSSLPDEAALSRMLLGADAVAIIDETGLPIVEVGIGSSPTYLALPKIEEPLGLGPLSATGTVVGLSPRPPSPGQTTYVRVDYRAPVLLGQSRALPLLVALVLSVNAGLLILVILYLRHLLRPLDALLDRAKSLRGAEDSDTDDVEMLLDTFERAVAALGERQEDGGTANALFEDDLAALQRTLATGLESGLLVLDARGDVLSLNPAGRQLLGVDGEIEPGISLEELLPTHVSLRSSLEEAVQSATGIQRRECDLEGTPTRTVGITVHPLRRDDGAVRGWLGLFADLTEIRQRNEEERLSESLEQIGALTAGLAHELRNGLASLRGYLTLIERNAGGFPENGIKEDLSELRHEADHLQRVVEDFLSFARPGSVRVEPVDLERLVHRAASDPVLAQVPIAVRSATDRAEVSGDPQLLERALRNLLHNAARAQKEGQHHEESVQVRIEGLDEGFEVLIADRGPGIAEAVRDRLFHPFASGSPQGVGLGLALSRRIAELHGGTVQLENRTEGGALARLRLPRDRFVTKSSIQPRSTSEDETQKADEQ